MRIKITEEQLKRVKPRLNESVDVIAQFEQFCKAKVQEVNKLYNRVIGLSVAEVINGEINISEIEKYLGNLENSVLDADKKAYQHIAGLPEQDLDLRIDKAYSFIGDKITSLNLILNGLERLQSVCEEHNLGKSFSDVAPLDITPKEI